MNDSRANAEFRTLVASFPNASGSIRVESPVPGVVEVVIDNVGKKNALTPQMMVALGDVAADPRLASAGAIILRGEGGPFCSGGDLDAVRDHLGHAGIGRLLGGFMADTAQRLRALNVVIIGVIDGPALGGGAELLVTCDEVFAGPAAAVGFVHARLGVAPGFGGGHYLVQKVGVRAALSLLTTALVVRGTELRNLSLVDHWSENPLHNARQRAESLAKLPQAALRGVITIIRANQVALSESREVELDVFDSLWGGPEHRKALERNR